MRNLILFVCLMLPVVLNAQSNRLSEEKRKEFESQKIAFYTQQLELTPEEAALFWPLYNEMIRKQQKVSFSMRVEFKKMQEKSNLTESEYNNAINNVLSAEEEIAHIKKTYYNRMQQILPASKLWKLLGAERRFHRQLFHKLHKINQSAK